MYLRKRLCTGIMSAVHHLLLLVSLILFQGLYSSTTAPMTLANPPLRIGAFNFQVFGVTKASKDDVMNTAVKIIRRYDIVLIQEVRDTTARVLDILHLLVNTGLNQNDKYRRVDSSRTGRSTSKEQYVFFFKPSLVTVTDTFEYDDGDETTGTDVFEREPFVVRFYSNTTEITDFAIIGIHTKPEDAVNEISNLTKVYDAAKAKFNLEDIIIAGDFNADCNYVDSDDWDNIALKTDKRFKWLIADCADTTVSASDCAYDRFVVAGARLKDAYVPGSGIVFKFDEAFNLTTDKAREVSDHYPVEIQLKGAYVSSQQRLLSTSSSYTITSSREVQAGSVSAITSLRSLYNRRTTDADRAGFSADAMRNYKQQLLYVLLTKTNVVNPTKDLRELQKKYPNIIHEELVLAVQAYQVSRELETLKKVYGIAQVPASSYEMNIQCRLRAPLTCQVTVSKVTKPGSITYSLVH